MSNTRRRYSAELKFKLAPEAAKGTKIISELASEAGIHPNQISDLKLQLLEDGVSLFQREVVGKQREHEALQAELYEQIRRLKMDLEWLKKVLADSPNAK